MPAEELPSARILGIETSCDETAAAVVEDGRRILTNVVASQADLHAQYGGVFPEVASRQHIINIFPIVSLKWQKSMAGPFYQIRHRGYIGDDVFAGQSNAGIPVWDDLHLKNSPIPVR